MRRAAAVLAFAAIATACVDNGENARQFCEAQAGLIDEARDRETLGSEEAGNIENDINSSMRDAEDATRAVRRSARDLLTAYGDLAGLLDDKEVDEAKLAEVNAELQTAREDVRAACADATAK